MKRTLLLSIIIFISLPLSAMSLLAGVDLMSFDSFYYKNLSLRFTFGLDLSPSLRLSLDGAYTRSFDIDNQLSALDFALSADYMLPSLHGLYVGVCVVNPVWLYGYDAPEENLLFISSISFGWRWDVPFFTLDLSISVYDPFKSSESAYQTLSKYLRQYSRFRFAALACFRYDM